MTCHELRLHFEDPLRPDAEYRPEAEHLAHCPECARFVESRLQLGAGLRQLRASAAQTSSTLDAAVLANYRRQIAHRSSSLYSKPRSMALAGLIAAAAVLAFSGTFLLHSSRNPEHAASVHSAPQQSSLAEPIAKIGAMQPSPVAKLAHPAKATQPHPGRTSPSEATQQLSTPEEFRSLMYCDPLSCSGAMELIRVQLPPAAAFDLASDSVPEPVYADVLVGSDGIARGIRIVQ